MANNAQRYNGQSKSSNDKVDDFFQLLIGQANNSNEFSEYHKLVVELNRGCDQILRSGGGFLKGVVNFIGGEANQNGQTRGEARHYEP